MRECVYLRQCHVYRTVDVITVLEGWKTRLSLGRLHGQQLLVSLALLSVKMHTVCICHLQQSRSCTGTRHTAARYLHSNHEILGNQAAIVYSVCIPICTHLLIDPAMKMHTPARHSLYNYSEAADASICCRSDVISARIFPQDL